MGYFPDIYFFLVNNQPQIEGLPPKIPAAPQFGSPQQPRSASGRCPKPFSSPVATVKGCKGEGCRRRGGPRFLKSGGINKTGMRMLCASHGTSPGKPGWVRTSRVHGPEIPIAGTLQDAAASPAPSVGNAKVTACIALILGLKQVGFGLTQLVTYPLADGVVLDGQLIALGPALSQQVLDARQFLLQDAVLLLEGQQRGHGPRDGRCGTGTGLRPAPESSGMGIWLRDGAKMPFC